MNQLPSNIRIGGTDYEVLEVQNLKHGDSGLNGHIIYNDCQIKLEQDMTRHVQWVTVWHEVIHGLLEHAGMSEHEEKMIIALGYGISQVLRDNEWLRQPPGSNTINEPTNTDESR